MDVLTAAERAARGELAWSTAGRPHAAAVLPLVVDAEVVLALPFSRTSLAQSLVGAEAAALVLSDSRMALRGWSPLTVAVHLDVSADREGDWTWTGALDQEVRKDAVARRLIDTPIQRREHWWYVPRWIVRCEPAGPPRNVPRRAGPDDGVLVDVDARGRVDATTVAVDDWTADRVVLTALDPAVTLDEPTAPARSLLFTHDFSIPDMERETAVALRGIRDGRVLTVDERSGAPVLEPVGGVLRRLGRHRRLARACRTALAAYDAGSLPAAT